MGLCSLATVPTPWGSRYLGYRLVLYTTIICQPVRILGNDYPGMGTVARLHKSAVSSVGYLLERENEAKCAPACTRDNYVTSLRQSSHL